MSSEAQNRAAVKKAMKAGAKTTQEIKRATGLQGLAVVTAMIQLAKKKVGA